jgi:hypothetical protein
VCSPFSTKSQITNPHGKQVELYPYSETNVMHFSFSLLRINGLQPCHSQLTLYARNIPNAVWGAPPEDEEVMLETCKGH